LPKPELLGQTLRPHKKQVSNEMLHINSPLITMKRLQIAGLSNIYEVKLNDEVVCIYACREQSGIGITMDTMTVEVQIDCVDW